MPPRHPGHQGDRRSEAGHSRWRCKVTNQPMNPRKVPPFGGIVRGFTRLWWWIRSSRPYRTYSRFIDVGGPVLSAGMSFQAVFAVFAALAVGFGVLAIAVRDNTEFLEAVSALINSYVPG